jgi:hypothetical protein
MYLIRGIQIHALWIYNTLRIFGTPKIQHSTVL